MKNFFKKNLLPYVTQIKSHPKLQFFGKLLHDPNLWHFNRHSLAGGMAVGLFCAFIPIPMQMLLASLIAIYFRVNLPLSVSLVWLTNPITMPPVFYGCYKLGTMLLGIPKRHFEFEPSLQWLMEKLGDIWQPFLLGCFTMAIVSAFLGYWIVDVLWRLQTCRSWRQRQQQRRLKRGLMIPKSPAKNLGNSP
jgi:hypothetical protein